MSARALNYRLAIAGLVALALACFVLPDLLGLDARSPNAGQRLEGPSWGHLLGTDALGRDLLARVLIGGRISLSVAAVSALVSVVVGGGIGLWAGYRGGWVDAVMMRASELFLAVPKLPLLVVLSAVDLEAAGLPLGPFAKLVLLISFFGWMTAARLSRAAILPLRAADFMRASRGFGASWSQLLRLHLARHALGPLLVAASLDLGEFIIYENVLSFLGLGVQPPAPSWGNLLAEAFIHLERAPLLGLVPGFATFMTVAAVHRVADGLRDALDPRQAVE